MGSSKYNCYALHPSNEPFPKNVSALKAVKNYYLFPLIYPDFNVWKKVGDNSDVQVLTILQLSNH